MRKHGRYSKEDKIIMAMKNNGWMTREEFEKLGTYGYCWIAYETYVLKEQVCVSYYNEDNIFEIPYNIETIKAVMPIEKPEYPKEV